MNVLCCVPSGLLCGFTKYKFAGTAPGLTFTMGMLAIDPGDSQELTVQRQTTKPTLTAVLLIVTAFLLLFITSSPTDCSWALMLCGSME